MTPINYQCFILPKEVLSAFLEFREKWFLYLYILFTEENRFEIKSIESIDIDCIGNGCYTLALSVSPIVQKEMPINIFQQKYPDTLFFRIGEFTQEFLRESWLFSLKINTDENASCLWKRIKNILSKSMCKGGYSVYIPTMKKKYVRTLRYTPAVLEYNKNGGLCLPEDGNNIIYELGLVDTELSGKVMML